ncbi:MAG: guanylate kinase [Candidatus Promineifilaceae bacterium]
MQEHTSHEPLLIVISGPSGVGKDTLARMLLRARNEFHFVVTATTRPPRPGEVNGRDYIFVNEDEFARMIRENELLEFAVVYNDSKGVPRQQIRDALASGRDAVMRVDVQGAAKIRKAAPNGVFIFLTAESEEALEKRLRARKADSDESIALRVATAQQEMRRVDEFDYCVVNAENQQERALQQLLCIIDAEHRRVGRQPVRL